MQRKFPMQSWVSAAGVDGGNDVTQSAIEAPQVDSSNRLTVRTLLGAVTSVTNSPVLHLEGANTLGGDWVDLASYDDTDVNSAQTFELERLDGASAATFLYRFLRWRIEAGTGGNWDMCFAVELEYD